MKRAIEIWQSDEQGWALRTVTLPNGEPGFLAVDVCRELGHTNPTMALRNANDGGLLDEDEIVRDFELRGDDQRKYNILTEAGLYTLILASRKPEARKFKKWVVSEVIPAIRKTGSYSLPAAPVAVMPTHSEALRGWAEALDENARKDRVIEQITPAAQAWDQFLNSDQDYSVREAAQILCRDKAIRIGEGRLFAYLRGARWIDSNNEPMQTQVNAKRLFRKADYKRNHKTGWEGETWQVRITPKGLGELHKLLGGQQSLNTLVWPELGLRVVGS